MKAVLQDWLRIRILRRGEDVDDSLKKRRYRIFPHKIQRRIVPNDREQGGAERAGQVKTSVPRVKEMAAAVSCVRASKATATVSSARARYRDSYLTLPLLEHSRSRARPALAPSRMFQTPAQRSINNALG